MQKDKIFINKIPIKTIIGVNDDERVNKQKIIISLTLYVDVPKAGKQDNINQVISYYEVTEFVEDYVSKTKFLLLETLAENIVSKIFLNFNIFAIKLRIEKPKAIKQTKIVGVEIYRERR